MKKRTISILLALVMVLSEASMCVFALDAEPQQDINETDLELMEEEPEIIPEENVSSEAEAAEATFNANCDSVTDSSATINWSGASEGNTVVLFDEDGTTEKDRTTVDATGIGSFNLSDLSPETSYTFVVKEIAGTETVAEKNVSFTTNPVVKPDKPEGLVAYSAYNCVVLEWNAVPNAKGYYVYKDGSYYKTVTASPNQKRVVFYATGIGDDNNHTFYVRSFVSSDNYSDLSSTVTKHRVRQMYIRITMKKKKTLTSHDRYKTKRTFKKGTTVTAFGFGGGKYRFYDGGRLYYVSYLSTKGAKAIYNGRVNDNWSRKEAEYFINTTGVASRTGWLIWVSQYDQHVYVFYGSKYNWRVYDDWEVSTGAAKTPSPTGFNKNIFKKVRNRHGLGPWSRFQSWTSFHGKKKSWKLGSPASHACIRCPSNKAMWIYTSIPLRTSVNVY